MENESTTVAGEANSGDGQDHQETNKPDDQLITVLGGIEIDVTKKDGSTERVKVRQIPISQIRSFVTSLSDEAACIDLYCDKSPPKKKGEERWADTLTYESASDVLDKGQELNLPFLSAWFRRQAKWRDCQNAGAIAELEKKVMERINQSQSASSQPTSPPSADSSLGT